MPRLTTHTYLSRHYQLKELWIQNQHRFLNLSYKDQIALHMYCLLSLEKSKAELLEHRRNVEIGDSSLPQRAGRAYARLARGDAWRGSARQTASGISMRAIARPDPDLRKIAKVSWQMALRDVETQGRRKRVGLVLSRAALHDPADVAHHPHPSPRD